MTTESGILGSGLARGWIREAFAWLASPAGRRVAAALLLLVAGQFVVAAYETVGLGLPLVREEPAGFAFYQFVQSAFALAAAWWLVRALAGARAGNALLDTEPVSAGALRVGTIALAAGAATTFLLLASPTDFHAAAQEDRPLEWASALLLMAAAIVMGAQVARLRGRPLAAFAALGLALLLGLIAMEEISWGQRLFGFATPDRLAELNWQSEFNLHNVQTDLSETLYYGGAAFFLLLLPLLRDLLPESLGAHPLVMLVPRRGVALISAPVAWLNYGHWNLFAIQLGTMLAFAACLAWMRAAWRRGRQAEGAAFLAAAAAILVGQILLLAFGPTMIEIPDATEYKEFFIALGFAFYAANVAGGSRLSASAGG